jgi:hypothetical protein
MEIAHLREFHGLLMSEGLLVGAPDLRFYLAK